MGKYCVLYRKCTPCTVDPELNLEAEGGNNLAAPKLYSVVWELGNLLKAVT